MRRFINSNQSTLVAVGFFILAAGMLIGAIIAHRLGMLGMASILTQVAGPASAAAAAVLISLALQRTETGPGA